MGKFICDAIKEKVPDLKVQQQDSKLCQSCVSVCEGKNRD
jgi:hypothetical protein